VSDISILAVRRKNRHTRALQATGSLKGALQYHEAAVVTGVHYIQDYFVPEFQKQWMLLGNMESFPSP